MGKNESRIESAMRRCRKVYGLCSLTLIDGTPIRWRVVTFKGMSGSGTRIKPTPISDAFADPDDAWLDAEKKLPKEKV